MPSQNGNLFEDGPRVRNVLVSAYIRLRPRGAQVTIKIVGHAREFHTLIDGICAGRHEVQIRSGRVHEHSCRSIEEVALDQSAGVIALVDGRIAEIVPGGAADSARETKLDGIKLVVVKQKSVVVDLSARRIPRDN